MPPTATIKNRVVRHILHNMMDSPNQTFEQARAGLPDVCPYTSVLWKPLHRLLIDGKPIDPVTILYFDFGPDRRLPFAAISKTSGNRLILWPPSDAREPGDFATGERFAIHHVTLELANRKSHLTRFDEQGERVTADRVWKLAGSRDDPSLWLVIAFRISLLERQVGALEQSVRMPTSDSERRVEEFRKYAATLRHVHLLSPAPKGDYAVSVIHVMAEPVFSGPIRPQPFPFGSFWNNWIEGWADGDPIDVSHTGVNVGGVGVSVLTASPSGCLKSACYLGWPT